MKLIINFLSIFILIAITKSKSAKNDADYLQFSFSNAELKDLIVEEQNPSRKVLDYDNSEDIGLFINDFFHDSQAQLILDLDLVHSIWKELDKFRDSAIAGDSDYIQVCLKNPLLI